MLFLDWVMKNEARNHWRQWQLGVLVLEDRVRRLADLMAAAGAGQALPQLLPISLETRMPVVPAMRTIEAQRQTLRHERRLAPFLRPVSSHELGLRQPSVKLHLVPRGKPTFQCLPNFQTPTG